MWFLDFFRKKKVVKLPKGKPGGRFVYDTDGVTKIFID